MEIKKCARCGNFYISEYEVCKNCEKKDTADVNKLKGFLLEGINPGTTKMDVAHSTGITMKNLNRYLNGVQFKEYNIPDVKDDNNDMKKNVVTEV